MGRLRSSQAGGKSKWITGDLNASMPVYVTRKTASGETGSLSLSIWMGLAALGLLWLNVVVWSVIALVYALILAGTAIGGLF